MIRTQALAIIEATLPTLDDADASKLAEIAQSLAHARLGEPMQQRRWTDEELAGIERSKADFAAGRTYTPDEARALSDAFLLKLRSKYPDAP